MTKYAPNLFGPGSQARTGPRGRGRDPLGRGRGRDPLGQGPGPGPLGPGAWGPLGPRCRIHVESVTTYCQASYLQSGKLPTVRQSYLQSGKATYSQAKLPTVRHAPNNRIHAPNRSIDMHPKGIDMHPKVSIDLHPTTAYFAPNRAIDMHPKGIDFAPKSSHRFAPRFRV